MLLLEKPRMLLISSLLLIALLIALNALYVAAEFAAVSVRKSRVQQLAGEGRSLAAQLLPVIESPVELDRYIATCQVGITLSSLILGAFGEAALGLPLARSLAQVFDWQLLTAYSVASIVILVLLTSAQMVLGELLPKAVALRFPAEAAMYTVVPLRFTLRILAPLIRVLNGSGLGLLRLIGVRQAAGHHVHSPDEIALMVRESTESGILAPEEARRLHSALRLSTRTVSQLMVPREQIAALPIDASADAVLRVATESPYTRLPVFQGSIDSIAGILHTKDVLLRLLDGGSLPPLAALLRPVITTPESTPADRLLVMFREQHSQQAIVTDATSKVVGLVTLEDTLAELFGELGDEFKTRRRRKQRKGWQRSDARRES